MDRSDDRVELEAEGIPDHFGPSNRDEGMIAPGDFPKAATDTGVTAAEQRFGDTLHERSQREAADGGRASGDASALSAEEAALRPGEERAG